jgi:hypothetical protein
MKVAYFSLTVKIDFHIPQKSAFEIGDHALFFRRMAFCSLNMKPFFQKKSEPAEGLLEASIS